jgi:hypothetical protein
MRSSALRRARTGFALVWATVILVVLIGIASLVVDYGRVVVAESELQTAADAAALHASGGIADGTASIRAAASIADNRADGHAIQIRPEDVVLGQIDPTTGEFIAGRTPADAVRVIVQRRAARGTGLPLVFGTLIGVPSIDLAASSVASDSGGGGSYIGLQLTRMFNDTRFDSYNSAAGPYSQSTSNNSGTLYSADEMLLDDDARVVGKAQYGSSGKLTKSSTAIAERGIRQANIGRSFPRVSIAPAQAANNNSHLAAAGLSAKARVSGAVTLQGGTYLLTELKVNPGASLTFTGRTTIYLDGDLKVEGTLAAATLLPGDLTVLMTANNKGEIKGNGKLYGSLYAAGSDVHHHDNGQSFGSVISDLLCFRHYAQGHSDTRLGSRAGGQGILAK